MSELYRSLCTFGDQIKLNSRINSGEFVDWTEEHFEYVRYNPRKENNRYGLSITSLNGNIDGIPDLDSLKEYNKENNTNYKEEDFNVKTPVFYQNPILQNFVHPWQDDLFRSHILKLGPGGFFPPHRDLFSDRIDSFRLISPLKNINTAYFILEDKILNWDLGTLYFVNTAKQHTLFNSSFYNSYWLVLNIKLNKNSFYQVLKHFCET